MLSAAQRSKQFDQSLPSTVRYEGERRTQLPPLAVIPFGLAYETDIVIVTERSPWDMHELVSVATPEGLMWLAKDARAETLEQLITSSSAAIHSWLPEIPVERFSDALSVSTHGEADGELNLQAKWTNPDGVPTQLDYRGPLPTSPRWRRNASTMGHSRDAVIAALDLSHMNWARHASIRYGDEDARIARIAWMKPFAMAIRQVQGGFATGVLVQRASPEGITSEHLVGGRRISQRWGVRAYADTLEIQQSSPLRRITQRFRGEDVHELEQIEVRQFQRTEPTMCLSFNPRLPDLGRSFSGVQCSRWVLDINGQPSHATGLIQASCTPEGAILSITPKTPHWVADRPLRTEITIQDRDTMSVMCQRRPLTSEHL